MNELPIKVQGIIYCKEDHGISYLIIKRREEDGGFWQSVTGTVNDGEKLRECLLREIKEEIGVTNIKQISDVISTFQWAKSDGFMITEYAYMVEVDPNCKIILSDEHIDYIWCGFDDAYKILGRDGNKRTLKLADKKLM